MFRSQLPLRAAVFLACSDTRDQSRHRILLSCFSCIGARPLCHAIRKGHADVVKMLIAYGASTLRNERDEENLLGDAPSPLIVAIRSGRSDIVAILLEAGASVDESEIGGHVEYPLHAAVRSEDYEIFHMVLKKGPKVDCVDFM
jgi:ankyrin repeat protein